MPEAKYFSHTSQAAADARNAIFYEDYGYNLIDPGTLIRLGKKYGTFRCFETFPHPTNNSVLMIVTPITRHHLDGTFTKESPDGLDQLGRPVKVKHGPRDGLPMMSVAEKARTKSRSDWKTEGFFSDLPENNNKDIANQR